MPPKKAQPTQTSEDDLRENLDKYLAECKQTIKTRIQKKQAKRVKDFRDLLNRWEQENQTEVNDAFNKFETDIKAALDLSDGEEEDDEKVQATSRKGKAKAAKGGKAEKLQLKEKTTAGAVSSRTRGNASLSNTKAADAEPSTKSSPTKRWAGEANYLILCLRYQLRATKKAPPIKEPKSKKVKKGAGKKGEKLSAADGEESEPSEKEHRKTRSRPPPKPSLEERIAVSNKAKMTGIPARVNGRAKAPAKNTKSFGTNDHEASESEKMAFKPTRIEGPSMTGWTDTGRGRGSRSAAVASTSMSSSAEMSTSVPVGQDAINSNAPPSFAKRQTRATADATNN
ncbi:uncharacterized protein PAC_06981 [Phialocephala subalpina]|uniref:Uncharacterized protein n=1 Tax=Phialocephala subalpina TaxID=576137 RepID=A0A1L7WWD8_9HELO|nr:uncharacterized protein PAC_06981 [Phialocephala subalpina]